MYFDYRMKKFWFLTCFYLYCMCGVHAHVYMYVYVHSCNSCMCRCTCICVHVKLKLTLGFFSFSLSYVWRQGLWLNPVLVFFSASQERQLLWEFPVPAFHASCMGSGYSNVNPHIVGHALLSQVPTPKIFQILSRHWNQCHFRSSLHIIRKCLKYNFQPGLSGMHLLF